VFTKVVKEKEMDNMKLRQRKTLRIPVTQCEVNEKNQAVEWMVGCSGTCGDNLDFHIVKVDRETGIWTCDCPGNFYGHVCVHVQSVYRFELRKKNQSPSFWKTFEQAKKQKRKIFQIKTGQRLIFGTIRV
jgi:hypothetical protein